MAFGKTIFLHKQGGFHVSESECNMEVEHGPLEDLFMGVTSTSMLVGGRVFALDFHKLQVVTGLIETDLISEAAPDPVSLAMCKDCEHEDHPLEWLRRGLEWK